MLRRILKPLLTISNRGIKLPVCLLLLCQVAAQFHTSTFLQFLLAKRRLNFVRIFTLGVLPEHHPVGIGALLYQQVWERGVRKGYVAGEMSWILEDNAPMNAAMQMMGGRIYKTWRIYDLPLR